MRLIHDCSRPHGQALNDYISTHSFKFQTLDDALALLKRNYFMVKIDLRHAYRSVPIHPSNFVATGLQWCFNGDDHPTYFYDTHLPFGAKNSPEIFHRLTQSVRQMMVRRGFTSVVVYLDDFLVIAPYLRGMPAGFFHPLTASPRTWVLYQLAQSGQPYAETSFLGCRIGYQALLSVPPI